MHHYIYIIYSKTVDKFYVGESPNVINRLDQHNSHYFNKGFTNIADDWKIVLSMECKSKDDALYLEKFIKKMKSKKFIRKIIKDKSILEDILSKK